MHVTGTEGRGLGVLGTPNTHQLGEQTGKLQLIFGIRKKDVTPEREQHAQRYGGPWFARSVQGAACVLYS